MLPLTELRIRNEENGRRMIEGHAAVFDSWSETLGGMFPFKEIVRKGAFMESIQNLKLLKVMLFPFQLLVID